jgi:hypothetical protein
LRGSNCYGHSGEKAAAIMVDFVGHVSSSLGSRNLRDRNE